MKINLLVLALLLGSLSLLNGQQNNFWAETSESLIPTSRIFYDVKEPTKAKYFELNFNTLKETLKDAPMEYTNSKKQLIVSFPLEDGSIERFSVVESPIMAPEMSAKYPNIKTYSGVSIDNPLNSIRFDHTPLGFHGSIHTPNGRVLLDPYTRGSGDHVIVYNEKDTYTDAEDMPVLGCGVTSDYYAEPDTEEKSTEIATNQLRAAKTPVNVRVYRLALTCTGEFAQQNGGTLESVNASFTTILNRLNQIFQLEVAIRVQLIPENDNLIFLDPDTDPYNNQNNSGSAFLAQTRPAFILNGIFDDMYDVGHLFHRGCSDVGGVVNGRACDDMGKSRGVTCQFSVSNVTAVVDVLAHEIAHQFSCGHSWDNCPSSANQRAGSVSCEPGSGTTIMSYSGACGDQNLGASDSYYNICSLESFYRYIRDVEPNCGMDVQNGNNFPVVVAPYEDGFFIPASTPFELTAEASDEDGDAITYCWEQTDVGTVPSPIGMPVGNAPIFRSRPPTTSPTRSFPSYAAVLANSFNNTEVMPTYDRDLTFACTVRDNVADGSGVVWDGVAFKVDGESGPFRLTFPSSLNHSLTAGEMAEFTWDPANSQNAPVNCKTVNLLLSYDNGASFTDTLARNVINDGSYFVNVPDRVSNNTRIKIEAADNIFYDFSNQRIEIAEATAPGFAFDLTPEFQEVCAPANISLDVFTASILDFDNPVELSIVSDIPDYVSDINIVNNALIPGEQSTIDLTVEEPGEDVSLELTIQAISENADTTFRTIQLDVRSNDFSSLSLDGPEDGLSGVVGIPDFVWSTTANVNSYLFELATSPTFDEESMIVVEDNITEPFYQLDQVLDATTLYYWRVTPSGVCGSGAPTNPSAFHSASFDCQDIAAEDLPINISTSFSGDIVSKINVTQGGTISDINIVNITGSHSDFSDLSFSITSPAGTTVRLVSNKCFAMTGTFDMAFDQESPFDFVCPPKNVFIPQDDLGAFTGEDTEGIWEFTINDRSAQFGGIIESWSLEFCSSIALNPPNLVRNNTLLISEDFEKTIDNNLLRVEDPNNVDWELQYTLVTQPEFGDVLLEGTPLNVGDTFSQFDLNNLRVSYRSDLTVGETDNFLFTVIDGDGGWTGTHRYEIEFVDQNVSASSLNEIEIEVLPNPVSDILYVKTNNNFSLSSNMEVYNLQGQLMIEQSISGNIRESINTNPLGNGIYFLKIQDGNNYSITKFVVEK